MNIDTEQFYELEFHDSFVIVTISKDTILTLDKANVIRNRIRLHFKSNDFVMITHRKFKHKVTDKVFAKGQLKNMNGLAIVSQEKTERDAALIQQKLFDKSFAFFTSLDAAKSWAEAYFLK